MLLPGIGEEGQRRLLASRVTLVGCGATGCVLAAHLARAGVGFLRVVDRDVVEWSNLQRQLLYEEADAATGTPKALAAAAHLQAANSSIAVEPVVADAVASNVEALLQGAHLVVDGTDNLETRYLLNDACVQRRLPWLYTGAVGTSGMTMLIRPGTTACLRCLFPEPAPPGSLPTCESAGVLGPALAVTASLAATEALKYLAGAVRQLLDALLSVEAWEGELHRVAVRRKEDCPCCVRGEFPYLRQEDTALPATVLCGRGAVQITPARPLAVSLPELAARLAPLGQVELTPHLLRFRPAAGPSESAAERPPHFTLFRDGRAIVHGVTDTSRARALYARYVGT